MTSPMLSISSTACGCAGQRGLRRPIDPALRKGGHRAVRCPEFRRDALPLLAVPRPANTEMKMRSARKASVARKPDHLSGPNHLAHLDPHSAFEQMGVVSQGAIAMLNQDKVGALLKLLVWAARGRIVLWAYEPMNVAEQERTNLTNAPGAGSIAGSPRNGS
jgi:hypothetical protein